MAARMQAQRIAKTLEKLFAHAIKEQQPLGFKESMKQTVRRACTTGVGYVKLCYQRQMGPSPSVEYRLKRQPRAPGAPQGPDRGPAG